MTPEILKAEQQSKGERRSEAERRSFYARHRWLVWLGGAALVTLAAVAVTLTILAHRFEPYLKARLVEGLEQRFHTKVELAYFHVEVRHGQEAEWGLWATGRGLRIWPPHMQDGDARLAAAVESVPLVDLKEFGFHVPLRWEQTLTIRVPEVRLKGLQIHVPPREERDRRSGLQSALSTPPPPPAPPKPSDPGALSNIVVQKILCDDAELVMETDKPNKLPLAFQIHHLQLMHVAAGKPMQFTAELVNAKPVGLIHTSGDFGPFDPGDPGASPLKGSYRFEKADLSTIKGIAGTLDSTGTYQGQLRALEVYGTADVPDFKLTHFWATETLQTRFHARVDGTDGDTWLDPVEATLGHSHFVTRGKVVRVRDGQNIGHMIDLKVDIDRAHADDLLGLVAKQGEPLLTGDIAAHALLHIGPGPKPVHERVKLDGDFSLQNVLFTNAKIQQKVEELSMRGLGHPDEVKMASPVSVRSEMHGQFHLANAVMTLPSLEYSVPGAKIELKGTYGLDGALNFDGTARMQATVSKMVGGWKGLLLKPADRFFKKDGAGTLVPIRVRGTRQNPDFGLNLHGLGGTHPETPGEK